MLYFFFFFNDTATTEIYTLSLHDALPIFRGRRTIASRGLGIVSALRGDQSCLAAGPTEERASAVREMPSYHSGRSEEHTSELQSRRDLVCRLLLEKKKNKKTSHHHNSK